LADCAAAVSACPAAAGAVCDCHRKALSYVSVLVIVERVVLSFNAVLLCLLAIFCLVRSSIFQAFHAEACTPLVHLLWLCGGIVRQASRLCTAAQAGWHEGSCWVCQCQLCPAADLALGIMLLVAAFLHTAGYPAVES
jgi:hypothetical protein